MYNRFVVNKVLIIAPLRVCSTVWEQEAQKWEHTKILNFTNLSGGKANMLKGLQRTTDVYLINRENVQALVEHLGKKWDFDMVVIDESSSFKSHSSKRFRAMKKIIHKLSYTVLLTGTPSPNGYIDLWSQFYLLDGGLRLGRTVSMYRQKYFNKDFFGHTYTLAEGSMARIEEKIQDKVLSMSSKDYLELPEVIPTVLNNRLEGKPLKQYLTLKKDMVLALKDEKKLTAVNTAVLTNKLLQFCSGNMYDEDGNVHHFHDLKIETLKEVIEENPNENILVAYNYKHELEALQSAFPKATTLDKKGEAVARWNNNEIPLLFAHPASASMGINLQQGGHILCWYGYTWNLEYYQQMNARLHRQGQKDTVMIIHISVGDVEDDLMKSLAQKDITQAKLLEVLKDDVKLH